MSRKVLELTKRDQTGKGHVAMNTISMRGIAFVGILLFTLLLVPLHASSEQVARISVAELNASLDKSNLTILDVRYGGQVEHSGQKITGAKLVNNRTTDWAQDIDREDIIVLYCA